ncbi:PTS IIA-like nitrogen-regulatory protein PtsN [Sphingopyxis sp. FD7]|nr:PTS IIA-like nitrogen-regulatory protein PtsN [Sphingopyxis sp. FD7]
MRRIARLLLGEQRRELNVRGLASLGLGGQIGHGRLEPLGQPVALGLQRPRLTTGEQPADQGADDKGNKGDTK